MGPSPAKNVAADLCRVTVVAPTGRADIAIPRDLTIAEVLPVLVRGTGLAAGPGRGGPGQPGSGFWGLQRFGEDVFDEDATLAQLDVYDGDVLHLRQREAAIPPIDFDDIVDGIASTVQQRTDVWQPKHSRWFLSGAAGLTAVAGLVPLLGSGSPALRCVVSGTLFLIMLVASTVFSRAVGDRTAATILGAASVAFAGFAGAFLPSTVTGDGFSVAGTASAAFLAAGAMAACAAVLAGAGVGSATSFFSCLGGIAGLATVLGVLLVWPGLSLAGAAALVVAVTYLVSVMSPNLVARIARLRVPDLPTNAEELNRDIEPHSQQLIAAKANAADRYLTAIAVAVATTCLAGFAFLASSQNIMAYCLLGATAAGLLLRTRAFIATVQRLSVAVAGLCGMLVLAAGWPSGMPIALRCVATVVLAVAAIIMASFAGQVGNRRWSPYLGRTADIAETLTALAVLPLAVGVAGGYAFAQGLAG